MPDKPSAENSRVKPPGIAAQFVRFLLTNKKWWLTPLILLALLAVALVVFGGFGVAPFIYSH